MSAQARHLSRPPARPTITAPCRLTAQEARQFYEACLRLPDDGPPLRIHLGQLEHIDCHGLGALVALDDHFRPRGGIRLLAPQAQWQILLEITRLLHLLETDDKD